MLRDVFHPLLLMLSSLVGGGQYLLAGRLPDPVWLYLLVLHATVVVGWRFSAQLAVVLGAARRVR
ncbi:MAG: hypothetical protein D6685_13350 [Bacteroidetes bacterium]|nr:MAG: hypothetical protein D6685_13350 [Bacteroidota bacterium]